METIDNFQISYTTRKQLGNVVKVVMSLHVVSHMGLVFTHAAEKPKIFEVIRKQCVRYIVCPAESSAKFIFHVPLILYLSHNSLITKVTRSLSITFVMFILKKLITADPLLSDSFNSQRVSASNTLRKSEHLFDKTDAH